MSEPDSGGLGRQIVADMERITMDRIGDATLEHARRSLPYLSRGASIAALRDEVVGADDSAIVIAAGPSIKRQDPAPRIKASGFRGAVISTDSGLAYCLRNGIVPDLVLSLDPHQSRIVRWFGDPALAKTLKENDDYFRRQDMDDSFANEAKTNQEVLDLVNRHGPDIRIALSTSAPPAVVERVLDAGMRIFWWNPMLDDPDDPNGRTRELYRLNRLPCMNGGGNVGTACWMMAHAVLEKRRIALVGVDFGYYADTPYERTQYYHDIVALVGQDGLDQVYMRVYNPHIGAWFYTDPAYMWYREAFLEMAADADCMTSNCTEGGILFGDPVVFEPLDEFLGREAPVRRPAAR